MTVKTLTISEVASMGGKARAKKLGPAKLKNAARKAVKVRWENYRKKSATFVRP
jgi:hypothetical protein